MGKATIVSGGPDGRYTIKMDYGKAVRDARVTKITARLAELATEITKAQDALDTQNAQEDTQKTLAETAITDYVTATKAIGPAFAVVKSTSDRLQYLLSSSTATPIEKEAAKAELTAAEASYKSAQDAAKAKMSAQADASKELIEAKWKTAPLQLKLDVLQDEKTQLDKDKVYQAGLTMEESLQAWCADLTEDATDVVATVEIPGENKVVLIAPGAPPHRPSDGVLVAREAQSPEQVFFNAAILPGWQKFKPTFRRGTITAIDKEGNTADVTFDDEKSSAQGLDINRYKSLAGLPVRYMTCHANAFEKGDACLVRFGEQNWSLAEVVGFASNPKPCPTGRIYMKIEIASYVREFAGDVQIDTMTNISKIYLLPYEINKAVDIAPVYVGTTIGVEHLQYTEYPLGEKRVRTITTQGGIGAVHSACIYGGKLVLTSRQEWWDILYGSFGTRNDFYYKDELSYGNAKLTYIQQSGYKRPLAGDSLKTNPVYFGGSEVGFATHTYISGTAGAPTYYKINAKELLILDPDGRAAITTGLSPRNTPYTSREAGARLQGHDFIMQDPGVYSRRGDFLHGATTRVWAGISSDIYIGYPSDDAGMVFEVHTYPGTPTGRIFNLSLLRGLRDGIDPAVAGPPTITFIPDGKDLFDKNVRWHKQKKPTAG